MHGLIYKFIKYSIYTHIYTLSSSDMLGEVVGGSSNRIRFFILSRCLVVIRRHTRLAIARRSSSSPSIPSSFGATPLSL